MDELIFLVFTPIDDYLIKIMVQLKRKIYRYVF